MLMVLVQAVVRRLPDSLCPIGRIHSRTCGGKGGLLKARKGKCKGEQVGTGGVCWQRGSGFPSQVLFNKIYGKGGAR
jgi:hypothetical protein